MNSVDVCVIGAGPAGSAIAHDLARAGWHVLVCEEHSDIGLPVDCSGIIGTEAFDKLRLPREPIRDELKDIEFISPLGKRVAFHPERVLAYVVDRAVFDQWLARQAVQAGATLWTEASVRDLSVEKGSVRLTIIHQGVRREVRGRVAVLAGGPRYNFQQKLGMGCPARHLRTVQAEIAIDQPGIPTIWLGSKVAPGSFAWWLPIRMGCVYRAKLGVSATRGSHEAFEAFRRHLQQLDYLNGAAVAARSWMIPISPLPKTYADRIVAVGDAAGQTKPTTGGGLYYGLLCAQMAAEVLSDALRRDDVSASSLALYEKRWRQALGGELATGQKFRRRFEELSDVEIDQMFELLLQDGVMRFLEREADFDWHRRTILRAVFRPPLAQVFLKNFGRTQLARLLS